MTPLLVPEDVSPASRRSPSPGAGGGGSGSVASLDKPHDPSRLAPEHAWYVGASPPRRHWERSVDSLGSSAGGGEERRRRGVRSSSRRKGAWKKLLWVKQSFPDNYTDPPTFLSALQRNPRLQQYDFWPLVADSTTIVQHVCSVAIFICCFVGIYHQQLSPISVVSWGSAGTVLGWVCWDVWIGQEEHARSLQQESHAHSTTTGHTPGTASEDHHAYDGLGTGSTHGGHGLGLSMGPSTQPTRAHSRNLSATSLQALSPLGSPLVATAASSSGMLGLSHSHASFPPLLPPSYDEPAPLMSARNQQRLSTVKSALLIYAALLGLSPILKSLTKSTTSDSIWAMSAWLMFINVFSFDYGGEVGPRFPASLSTNAALMASTVLASRLTTITDVFSLTLFSIEVFGLFPVFRRHLRQRSWPMHVAVTVVLIVAAGAALGVTLVAGNRAVAALVGVVVWGLAIMLAMGGCSWWLIGLQRYKNVVIGPWDQARPIIRAGVWE